MIKRIAISLSAASLLLLAACGLPARSIGIDLAEHPLSVQLSSDVDRLVADTVDADGPGVAVLVMVNNQIFYADGHGLSNIAERTSITSSTVFDLASVSKQMTAIALLKLVESGDVDLDAPVANYLSEFAALPSERPVLVKQLLHHTSGLDDYTSDSWDGSEREFANLDLEAHLDWVMAQALWNEPGAAFEYNNSGYALLALIVQRVSGQSFPDYMQTEIFQPLGMENTLVYSQLGQAIPQQAQGYLVRNSGEAEAVSSPSVIAGDGNVFSSLADIAQYDRALRRHQLVSAATLGKAIAPGELSNGWAIRDAYGMGWEIADTHVHHGGGWVGTSTYYRHYTDVDLSIVVLSNNENYDAFGLGEEIAELFDLENL